MVIHMDSIVEVIFNKLVKESEIIEVNAGRYMSRSFLHNIFDRIEELLEEVGITSPDNIISDFHEHNITKEDAYAIMKIFIEERASLSDKFFIYGHIVITNAFAEKYFYQLIDILSGGPNVIDENLAFQILKIRG